MKERPEVLDSKTMKIKTGYGNLYVTITECDGQPFEVFCTIGKSGGSIMAKAEVTGRLVSLALRKGIDLGSVINQLVDICGEKPYAVGGDVIKSIPDAVGKVLKKYLEEKTGEPYVKKKD